MPARGSFWVLLAVHAVASGPLEPTGSLEPATDENIWTLPGDAWRLPHNVSVLNYTCDALQQKVTKKYLHGCCNVGAGGRLPLPPWFTLGDLMARWSNSNTNTTNTTEMKTTIVNFV